MRVGAMGNFSIHLRAMSACFVLLAANGPVLAQQKVNYTTQVAPRYPAVSAMRSLGVLPFNGRDGANFTSSLAAKLQSANLDGAPVFELRTMDSLNFKSEGVISRTEMANAIRNGQKLGVKLVFIGVVNEASVRETPFTKEVTRCEGGNIFSGAKCTNRSYTVPCKRVTGQYSVTPQAIRVDNGTVLFSEVISRNAQYEQCADGANASVDIIGSLFKRKDAVERSAASTPEALLMELREQATEVIKKLVAPYSLAVEVQIKNATDGLPKADNETFRNAVAFAKAQRMDRACALFEGLNTAQNASNVGLLYNLGVCQEVMLPDDPAAAMAYYAKADGLMKRPDKMVSEAYLRIKQLIANDRNVSRLGAARQ